MAILEYVVEFLRILKTFVELNNSRMLDAPEQFFLNECLVLLGFLHQLLLLNFLHGIELGVPLDKCNIPISPLSQVTNLRISINLLGTLPLCR